VAEDRDLPSYPAAGADERTAIASSSDLKEIRREIKDRHLLVRLNGAQLGRVTRLTLEPSRLGRAPECEIWVGDDGVSRKHAQVVWNGTQFVLRDTESANGTFVSGRRVQEHVLSDGDVLQLGPSAMFRYALTEASQEALLRQLFEASVSDPLTGIHNREYFEVQLRAELSFARRHKSDVALVLFDVDLFKNVNDTYGHQTGDKVLIEIAQAIQGMVRNEDILARYGGEEFAMILRGIDIKGAHAMGERLRTMVASLSVDTDSNAVKVTISAGCACVGNDFSLSPEDLVGAADRRLYAAKHAGRNRVVSED
jgi:diguanylate cyclase (GGDEF)-like protein